MKQNRNQIPVILIMLSLFAVLFLQTALTSYADEIPASGTWGTCPWEIDADGKLIVHPGTGENTDGSN